MSGWRKRQISQRKIMNETCGNCIWANMELNPNSQQHGQLICKMNPPTPFAIAVPTANGIQVQVLNLRPTMSKDDYCAFFDDDQPQIDQKK